MSELHFIRARLRGGILPKARRGELITPLPVGLAYDAAGHVILDPDTAVRGAVAHLFATFTSTRSATACVKAFNTAGLSFPWRHRMGPRKGEIDWKPLAHHVVLRILHNPRYAGAFTFGRHRDIKLSCPAPRCPARNGSPSSPAPTPDTSPWISTTPTGPAWPPAPPRTAVAGPQARPAKDPRSCRASSSAGPAGSA